MKILQVVPALDVTLGGPTQVVIGLSRALKERGIEVEIATTTSLPPLTTDSPTLVHGVPMWQFPSSRFKRREFIPSRAFAQWLYRNCTRYDLLDIHYLFTFSTLCATTTASLFRIPYTMRSMGQLAPWALAQRHMVKLLYASLFERRALAHARAIQCTSDEERREVQRFGVRTPCHVIELGVSTPSQLPDARERLTSFLNLPAEAPTILFLSRLHPKKQPECLIRSLLHLRLDVPPHLILAGAGDKEYERSLRMLVISLGLSDRVHFTGFVDGERKEILLQGSDLFALPSITENFGIAVAEALIRSKPAVISRGIQIAQSLDKEGALLAVEPFPEAFAAALQILLSSPEKANAMGARARQVAKVRFSWDTIAEQTECLYRSILESGCSHL